MLAGSGELGQSGPGGPALDTTCGLAAIVLVCSHNSETRLAEGGGCGKPGLVSMPTQPYHNHTNKTQHTTSCQTFDVALLPDRVCCLTGQNITIENQ